MRDRNFIAEHRGGLLNIHDHRLLAKWAADCAEHVLLAVWKNKKDQRPFRAVETARAWSRGENRVGDCQKAAVAAHAAARACKDPAAIAAARCAGNAVATAHMADHCFGVSYALKAATLAGMDLEKERAWQKRHLPKRVRELVLTGEECRRVLGRLETGAPSRRGEGMPERLRVIVKRASNFVDIETPSKIRHV